MTKKEFAPGFREWAGRARIESKYEVKDIHASGDVAYLWSHISIVMTSKESGSSTKREGHVLSVFRKSPSGKWLLAATQTHPHGQAGASVKKIRVSTPGYLYAPLSDIVTSAIKPNVQIEQNSVSFDRFRRGGPLGVRLFAFMDQREFLGLALVQQIVTARKGTINYTTDGPGDDI